MRSKELWAMSLLSVCTLLHQTTATTTDLDSTPTDTFTNRPNDDICNNNTRTDDDRSENNLCDRARDENGKSETDYVKSKSRQGTFKNSEEKSVVDEVVEHGLKVMKELYEVKEPELHKMGLYLKKNDPASRVAAFSTPNNLALELAKYGYAAVEASKKFFERFPEDAAERQSLHSDPPSLRASDLENHCPQLARRRCARASKRYRTPDGSCNNLEEPWKGASLMPMLRFLPARYNDGIQSVRLSVFGRRLPSPREVSTKIHSDRNLEARSVTLMFMQWGQFIDHDMMATAQSRGFNGTVPQCCDRNGQGFLPSEFLHPSCLPIEVPQNDWFFSQFGIRCMEFVRSAPTARINCDLGWREQINQATPFVDASTLYGSDFGTSEIVRTFRNGELIYGRGGGILRPPDPPGGELCRTGVITTDCYVGGDGRSGEQPGLTAFHTVWVRFHNRIASNLGQLNPHWSDEKIFQETRKIIGALVQHVTYNEFLPVLLGPEVMQLFDLNLLRKGYYEGYDRKVNPAIANSFGAAAFRFGHSLVQNSYVRTDTKHREIFNNVTLHQEQENVENIWSFGSLDRLLLGFSNQPSQRRDEFMAVELTNHLFQSRGVPFGLDLAAINIQRGRDHGLPPYTAFRTPCGLTPVNDWQDLEKIMNFETIQRFRTLYAHVDDIDLFSGGLAERPVRGGIVGPTFACIIAQQFSNLRKGDRFWYENGNFVSSFTPAQLEQLRLVTFAQVLCRATDEIETIQMFVFLSPDDAQNVRLPCSHQFMNNFDLKPWIEINSSDNGTGDILRERSSDEGRSVNGRKKTKKKTKTTKRPTVIKRTTTTIKPTKPNQLATTDLQNKYSANDNLDLDSIPNRPHYQHYYRPSTNSMTYLIGYVPERTTSVVPFKIDIKIQYLPPKPVTRPSNNYDSYYETSTTKRPVKRKQTTPYDRNKRTTTKKPCRPADNEKYTYRPQNQYNSNRPYSYHFVSNLDYATTKRPKYRPQKNFYDRYPSTKYPNYLYFDEDDQQTNYNDRHDAVTDGYSHDVRDKPTFGQNHKKHNDRFDASAYDEEDRFVKISSARGTVVKQRGEPMQSWGKEGDLELGEAGVSENADEKIDVVAIDVVPSEVSDELWMFYNAKEEQIPVQPLPQISHNISYSDELPRPISLDV